MNAIEIFDTTLRDGEQSPGASMPPAARLEIARMLDEAGVDTIEAGFPAASPIVAASVAEIAASLHTARVAALARCVAADIERAAQALRPSPRPMIHVFVATSDLHIEHKLRTTRERVLEMTAESVRYARRFSAEVEFSAEDATRTDRRFLARVLSAAVRAGATTINVPDTVGYSTPAEMQALVGYLRRNVDNVESVRLSVHTHDDLGMATANALAAVAAGATQVECTINGIGERAGNCALEEIVCALGVRRDLFACTARFDTRRLAVLSRAVAAATNMPVQKNKAVVGENAFAHESGIHQDGVLKRRTTYEILDPAAVGAASTLPLGRNSGRHALFARAERLGITLDVTGRERFASAFAKLAAERAAIGDAELLALAASLPAQERREREEPQFAG